MKTCICILSVRPCALSYSFYKTLKNTSYDVIIVADDDKHNIPGYDGKLPVVKIPTDKCIQAGFKGSVQIPPWKDTAYSRDKALYYFSKINTTYDNVWFIEEDVFVPNIFTISDIDKKVGKEDLVSAGCLSQESCPSWVHWKRALSQTKLPPPYFKSMICAIRCSRSLINLISNYADEHKSLFMDEVLFTTIAKQNNLSIITPSELNSVRYRKNWDNIYKHKLYHPMKSIKLQHQIREMLATQEPVNVSSLYHNRPD